MGVYPSDLLAHAPLTHSGCIYVQLIDNGATNGLKVGLSHQGKIQRF